MNPVPAVKNYVDLSYVVQTTSAIPADHGYLLYSALSRAFSVLHRENGVAIHPLRGQQIGNRQLSLHPWSRLILRAPADRIPDLIQLTGKQIDLGGVLIRIGIPQVLALTPAPTLRSRLVTIKGFFTPEDFQSAVRRQLDALEISEQIVITVGRKRTLRIKQKEVIGFEVILEGLTAKESLTIQENGIGGRRHMGCGVFVPVALNTGVKS